VRIVRHGREGRADPSCFDARRHLIHHVATMQVAPCLLEGERGFSVTSANVWRLARAPSGRTSLGRSRPMLKHHDGDQDREEEARPVFVLWQT
jgi:hypothetical protein